jgi:hypothetical protein
MLKKIFAFFDKFEDKVRGRLSRWPISYALICAAGVVLFWRGIWHTADFIMSKMFSAAENQSIGLASGLWWDGPLSLGVGIILLLTTGALVYSFIGNEIIISGLRGEKKIAEKTETEVKEEVSDINEIKYQLRKISEQLEENKRGASEQKRG